MKEYKYLIIGGGMAAASTVEGIREIDSTGSIGLISAETDAPYNRPPLSKALWKGTGLDSIWRDMGSKKVEIHLGVIVKEIDPERKRVICENGDTYSYEKLMLATGVRPKKFSFGDDSIMYFRTLSDYRNLRALSKTASRVIVIGGGFIGSEIAAALTMNSIAVTMIFPGESIGDRIFPADLSRFVNKFYEQKGVEMLSGEKIVGIEKKGSQYSVKTADKKYIAADGIVAGIGTMPNIELAKAAKLEISDGILVNEFLQTSNQDVYAAGDVAAFFNPSLEKRIRAEHEDNANVMGSTAGRNMAGKNDPYNRLQFFYSDMFELGYEAVGELDSLLETFSDWKKPFEEGVIYYLKNDRVRGVLLWNVWNQADAARELISEPGPHNPSNLKGRLK